MKEKLHRECYAISSRDLALGRAYVLGEDISPVERRRRWRDLGLKRVLNTHKYGDSQTEGQRDTDTLTLGLTLKYTHAHRHRHTHTDTYRHTRTHTYTNKRTHKHEQTHRNTKTHPRTCC